MVKMLLAISAFAACAGCNTVAGLGKDLQSIGGAISSSADDVSGGRTEPVKGDPAACLPDAQGRVPSANCQQKTN